MSRADGVLRVVLTGKWFDMIESGEKLEEYRGRHWAMRLLTDLAYDLNRFGWDAGYWTPRECYDFRDYHTFAASRGYTSRILTRKIKRIRWGAPRPEWSGDAVTGECFIIELGDKP